MPKGGAKNEHGLTEFVAAYKETGSAQDAFDAINRLPITRAPETGSYVYLILCPSLEKIIYVGKGTKNRMHHHVRDAIAGKIQGRKKHKALLAYIARGCKPVPVVFADDLDSDHALKLERILIHQIGYDHLSNSMPGQYSKWERGVIDFYDMKSRLKNVCQWIRTTPITPYSWEVVPKVWQQMRQQDYRIQKAILERGEALEDYV